MSATTTRVKGLLEKALSADSCYLPAVYLLADILNKGNHTEKAIDLLHR